jgi:hypothetical protein
MKMMLRGDILIKPSLNDPVNKEQQNRATSPLVQKYPFLKISFREPLLKQQSRADGDKGDNQEVQK